MPSAPWMPWHEQDFARDTLHLSLTDAMGHAVNASMLATILVGGLRNARRAGVELGEQARLASASLGEYAGWSDFVTGQVARIDLRTRAATIVNAGHPLPLRLRDGQVTPIALEADPPFGIVRTMPRGVTSNAFMNRSASVPSTSATC